MRQSRREFIKQTLAASGTVGLTIPLSQLTGRDRGPIALRQSEGIHVRIGMDWNDPAAAPRLMAWAKDTRQLLRPSSGERIYANYQSDSGEGTAEAVFGGSLSRLVALKTKYDPTNFFRRNSAEDKAFNVVGHERA